jgi:hypothetical protein
LLSGQKPIEDIILIEQPSDEEKPLDLLKKYKENEYLPVHCSLFDNQADPDEYKPGGIFSK